MNRGDPCMRLLGGVALRAVHLVRLVEPGSYAACCLKVIYAFLAGLAKIERDGW